MLLLKLVQQNLFQTFLLLLDFRHDRNLSRPYEPHICFGIIHHTQPDADHVHSRVRNQVEKFHPIFS